MFKSMNIAGSGMRTYEKALEISSGNAANLKTTGLDSVNAYFDSIAAAYNMVYWNYNENYDMCLDTANFCASVHMNPEGTHQFTVDFANRLKEEILSAE